MCRSHMRAFQKYGDPGVSKKLKKVIRPCKTLGCLKDVSCKEMCRDCYAKDYRGPSKTNRWNGSDPSGQKFNRLTVVRITGSYRGRAVILAKCDCDGKVAGCSGEIETRLASIRDGHTTSCGCANVERAKKIRSPQTIEKGLYGSYIWHAKERGLLFEIGYEKFLELIGMNCNYCNCPPAATVLVKRELYTHKVSYNGLDRVESNGSYTTGNVVTCCKACNRAKREHPVADYLRWMEASLDIRESGVIPKSEYISVPVIERHIFSTYRIMAKKRKKDINFDLDFDYFKSLLAGNCTYCKNPPFAKANDGNRHINKRREIVYSGIDRINSDLGYVVGNVCSCCRYCNIIKSDRSVEEFKLWLSSALDFRLSLREARNVRTA